MTSCTNRCKHCWTQGDPQNHRVPVEQVYFVLDKLAEFKNQMQNVWFFLYDEPTTHPQFIEIIERANELGLIGEEYFLATNGSVLASASDDMWERLKRTGVNCLQLTVYGLEKTHDEFAGRHGAFQNIVTTIQRATEHGIEWYAQVFLHPDNVSELADTIGYLKSLDCCGKPKVGWMPFLWQGRGRDAHRLRAKEFMQLPVEMRERATYLVEERQAIQRILQTPELACKRASESMCSLLTFQVDRDLKVFCGGSCDSGGIMAAAPELSEEFALGTLGNDGFLPILEAYQEKPPRPLQLLDDISWKELAERYGDKTNDEIYYLNDLPEYKWSSAYLLEAMKGS